MGSVGDMNEHETNPQRHEGSSPEELSHQPADASQDSGTPAGGQFSSAPAYQEEPTAQQPVAPHQPVAPQSAPPQSAPPQSTPAQSTSAESAAPQSAAAQQPTWGPATSPWQQHQPYGAYQQQHPGYTAQQQYPGYAQQQAYQGQYAGAYAPGSATPPQHPLQPGQEGPDWAQPVGTEERDPARVGRGRRLFVTGAAAIVLALAAGGVGAATALAVSDNDGNAAVQTSNSSVTRVVDRSSLAEIASAVRDSVVSITTQSGEGSGVILSADGYIVTNNHVVATAQGTTVQVVFANGKKATATIVGTDPRTDLAVVKASGVSDLKAAHFGSSANMQVGDTVLALGSPLGLEGSVTSGIISAKDRTIQSGSEDQQTPQDPFGGQQGQQGQAATTIMSGLLQTDAPINPGNSGGALVNTNGEVIGINSAIATSGGNSGNIGLGFAIPSDKATQVAKDLMAGKKVSHPTLGVSVTEADGSGALVSNVTPNSAAAKAGLQQGDVITSVNGKTVGDSNDLVAAIQSAAAGDKVTVTYTRNGAQKTVSATLGDGN
jgi:putative serine protease PepD